MSIPRKESASKRPPAKTPEAREQQLISSAVDLAERQLRDGTASASTVNHYLKLASSRENLEQKKIRGETRLLDAKYNAIETAGDVKALYADAIDAMRSYQGMDTVGEADDV